MRVELNRPIKQLQDVQAAVGLAQISGVDALYSPPVFLSNVAAQLGRSEINLVTTVARPEDLLDTKLAGIDAAARDGADELIVCVPHNFIADWDWARVEKEIEQLKVACSAYRKFLWIGCGFHYLTRVEQVRMAELIGQGAGLRLRDPELSDIAIAKICGVDHICTGVAKEDFGVEAIENFESQGVTQMVFTKKPPQAKTDKVTFNEL